MAQSLIACMHVAAASQHKVHCSGAWPADMALAIPLQDVVLRGGAAAVAGWAAGGRQAHPDHGEHVWACLCLVPGCHKHHSPVGTPARLQMHFPLHTSVLSEVPTEAGWRDLRTVLTAHDNVRLVLSGHCHKVKSHGGLAGWQGRPAGATCPRRGWWIGKFWLLLQATTHRWPV